MKKDNYFTSLHSLAQELSNFQELLNITYKSEIDGNLIKQPLGQMINVVQGIKVLVEEVKREESLTLLNQDFSNFCLLLIYGSDMADCLLARDETSKKIQNQARHWKDIAAKFRPFLKNSIYNRTETSIHL